MCAPLPAPSLPLPSRTRLPVAVKGSQECAHPPPWLLHVLRSFLPGAASALLACLVLGKSQPFSCVQGGSPAKQLGWNENSRCLQRVSSPLVCGLALFGDSVIGMVSKQGQNPTQGPARLDTWALWWECVAQGKPPGAKFVVTQPPSWPQALENTVMTNVHPCRAGQWRCFSPLPALVGGNPLHIC